MISIKHKFATLALLALAIFLLVPMSTVIAQEENPVGGDRGVDIIAGPHAVRVVLINSNLSAGFIQMALFVTDANTGEIVLDARVVLIATNEGEEYEAIGTAHKIPNDPGRYDGRMNLGSTGDWVIAVNVSSELGEGGADALFLEVPALNRYTDGSLVFFGIFGAMMLGIAYLFWSVKRENRRRATPAEAELGEADGKPKA